MFKNDELPEWTESAAPIPQYLSYLCLLALAVIAVDFTIRVFYHAQGVPPLESGFIPYPRFAAGNWELYFRIPVLMVGAYGLFAGFKTVQYSFLDDGDKFASWMMRGVISLFTIVFISAAWAIFFGVRYFFT